MKVTKLSLKNFRGFRETKVIESNDENNIKGSNVESDDENDIEQKARNKRKEEIEVPIDIEFPSDPNVIVLLGVNGSGKSSILDALGTLLFQFVKVMTHDSDPHFYKSYELQKDDFGKDIYDMIARDFILNPTRPSSFVSISKNDIHNKSKDLFISLDCKISSDETLNWSIVAEEAREAANNIRPTLNLIELQNYGSEFYDYVEKEENIPILAFYQIDRIAVDKAKPKKDVKYLKNQFYAYEGAFDNGINEFSHFLYWFENKESRENEAKARGATPNNPTSNPGLSIVRNALEIFLSNIPEANFKEPRIVRGALESEYSFENPFSLVFAKKGKDENGNEVADELKLEQLSSGEKTILMLVGDIARRIAIANPGLSKLGAKHTLDNATGIVLIDEIELHLHPKWQSEVLNALHKTFPKIQFIVTTHSPIACVYLRKNYSSIFALENNQIKSIDYYYGKDVNNFLSRFGINRRPKEIQDKIDLMYQYYEEELKEDADKIYKELLDILGKDDIDMIEFEAYKEYN